MYNINTFLNELHECKSTEREVFDTMLHDCKIGMDAVRTTNKNPTKENFEKETEILKEIICQ